jgi:hypothetical protein
MSITYKRVLDGIHNDRPEEYKQMYHRYEYVYKKNHGPSPCIHTVKKVKDFPVIALMLGYSNLTKHFRLQKCRFILLTTSQNAPIMTIIFLVT